jgi:hypothetical protein
VLLLNECLLLLFISLSTQFGNFWIHPRIGRRCKMVYSSAANRKRERIEVLPIGGERCGVSDRPLKAGE